MLHFTWYNLPPYIVALGLFIAAVVNFIKERRTPSNYALSLLGLIVAIWLASFSQMYTAAKASQAWIWGQIGLSGIYLIPAAVYFFTVSVLGAERWSRFFIAIGWSIGLLLIVLQWSHMGPVQQLHRFWFGFYPDMRTPAFALFILLLMAYFGMSFLACFHAQNRSEGADSQSLLAERMLQIWLVAAVAIVDVLPGLGLTFYPFGFIAVALSAMMQVNIVLQFQMLEARWDMIAARIFGSTSEAMIYCDHNYRILMFNSAAGNQLGLGKRDASGSMSLAELFDSQQQWQRFCQLDQTHVDAQQWTFPLRLQSGDVHEFELAVDSIKDPLFHRHLGYAVIARDVNELRQLQRQLELMASLPAHSPGVVLQIDLRGYCLYRNHVGHAFLRALVQAYQTSNEYPLPHELMQYVTAVMADNETKNHEFVLNDDTYLLTFSYNPDYQAVNLYGVNISDRKIWEADLMQQVLQTARHDIVTDLPNRLAFEEALNRELQRCKRHEQNQRFAILMLDFDDFKRINDHLGHDTGNRFLYQAGQRLQDSLKGEDFLARIGGDEFMIITSEEQDTDWMAGKLAKRLIKAFQAPFNTNGHKFMKSISIGIAIYPDNGDEINDLMQNADRALFRAKSKGKNASEFYSEELSKSYGEKAALETCLHEAFEDELFHLAYQPLYDLSSYKIFGVEALLRLRHPSRGDMSPGQFIPVAEETGNIRHIDYWVINAAIKQYQNWLEQNIIDDSFQLHINVSSYQLANDQLADDIEQIVSATQIVRSSLVVEITETAGMQQLTTSRNIIEQLKAYGFQIALDDFGMGYSSLERLSRLPIDILKIDRQFIRDIEQNPEHQILAQAIINLGRALHMSVIAEGIETQQEEAYLRERSCRKGQGFYFAHPLINEDIVSWLSTSE